MECSGVEWVRVEWNGWNMVVCGVMGWSGVEQNNVSKF